MRRGRPARDAARVALVSGTVALLAGTALVWHTRPVEAGPVRPDPAAGLREIGTITVGGPLPGTETPLSGVVEPRRTVELSAQSAGVVHSLGAEALDRVAVDQVLVRLDPVLAEVELEEAAAGIARAESEHRLARAEEKRARALAARGVLSAAALEEAENRARVAEASLREARALHARARDGLARKTLRAPVAGELRRLDVERGEFVREGQVLAELIDLAAARIRVGLTAREVIELEPGPTVQVRPSDDPGRSFEGVILRVGAVADPESRRFPVEIEVPRPDGALRPGTVAVVEMDDVIEAPRIVVPREAMRPGPPEPFVWVVEPSSGSAASVVHRRPVVVRPAAFRPGHLEVVEGLAVGEEIAITEVESLEEGEAVRRPGDRAI